MRVLSKCSQVAHKHHKVILHFAFGLLLVDLGQHVQPAVAHFCEHFGLGSCGSFGAALATACEYLRGAEPAA